MRALQDAQATPTEPVPLHLRNAPTPLMREMGHGRDYQYDHAFPEHYAGQQHLPDKLSSREYYVPGELGYEGHIGEQIRKRRAKPRRTDDSRE